MPRRKIKEAIRSTKIQYFLFGVVVALAVIFISIRIIDIEVRQRAVGTVEVR